MKNYKYIIMSALAALALSATAQDFDNDPTLKIDNKDQKVNFTVGARFMADAAYYHTDFTPLQSGASITDARIRTSMTYGQNWYFYADFGFGNGKFSQKNIFLQYATKNASDATHAIKVGYYNDPAGSMARQTSLGSYHFISRAGMSNAIGAGRELGITYKYSSNNWFLYQGVFTENQYNKIDAGFNGYALSGRWLYRQLDCCNKFHVGVNARFLHLGGGETVVTKGSSVLKKTFAMGQSLETYVDEDEQFVGCELPWANNVIDLGAEALYLNKNFFVRGEFKHRIVTKSRDSYKIFIASQDNIDGWGDIELWENANKLKTNHFNGAYIEAGYKLFGGDYKYNKFDGVMGGLDGKSLEIVARFNYTGLNDLTEGEYFSAGRNQYYAAGYMEDWPGTGATSVGGGDVYSTTVGVNYSFNKFAQVMLDYTWHKLDKDFLPYDKNIHQVQARVQFTF
ncbi:MAG: hypothetical protein PUD64_06305 [Bacteroidales bacterium]|nr:hypothetical protein [Bacteroidales bacterium]